MKIVAKEFSIVYEWPHFYRINRNRIQYMCMLIKWNLLVLIDSPFAENYQEFHLVYGVRCSNSSVNSWMLFFCICSCESEIPHEFQWLSIQPILSQQINIALVNNTFSLLYCRKNVRIQAIQLQTNWSRIVLFVITEEENDVHQDRKGVGEAKWK